MSWLGYAGTLGAEFVHQIVTDPVASPPETAGMYAEKCRPRRIPPTPARSCAAPRAPQPTTGGRTWRRFVYLSGSTLLCSDHAVSRREVALQHGRAPHDAWPSHYPAPLAPGSAFNASDPAAQVPTRAGLLGKSAHVPCLCSFNQLYKLGPETWRRWVRVLRRAPHAVLWQLEFDEEAVDACLALGAEAGLAPERLLFTPLLAPRLELLTKGHCDLYLDTWPFNAHSTAKDALWAGVPVLTLPGEPLAARLAASLVALVLPGAPGVARTPDDYEETATRLAAAPAARARLRGELRARRWHSPAFDPVTWAAQFSRALRAEADLILAGCSPPARAEAMHLLIVPPRAP